MLRLAQPLQPQDYAEDPIKARRMIPSARVPLRADVSLHPPVFVELPPGTIRYKFSGTLCWCHFLAFTQFLESFSCRT